MTQVLLPSPDSETVTVLSTSDFVILPICCICRASRRISARPPACDELNFVPYDRNQRGRLMDLVERTYEGTLDCAGLERCAADGACDQRLSGDGRVSAGELAVRSQRTAQDVGVLLLADHPQGRHWELMYMGLVPEARGRGWGGKLRGMRSGWRAGRRRADCCGG